MQNNAPQSLITEASVKKVLESDKGSDALLKTWKVVDFTKPGDNFACTVTSVEVKYMKENTECQVTYVVKLNPLRNLEGYTELTPFIFHREGSFYQDILPALNDVLISAGQHPLRLPKCFHVSLEGEKEQLYMEDLRAKGFKMFDRRKGMDTDHAILVLTELARLHSASYLLVKKYKDCESLAAKYEYLGKGLLTTTASAKEVFLPIFEQEVDTGIMILERIGGYETAINWLNLRKPEIESILTSYLKSGKFNNLCHGDCSNNNILFRYNEEGRPIEVVFVDFQMCQEGSIAYDLNYFLYSSLNSDIRRPNLNNFMSIYYSSYKKVLEAENLRMYFSKEELFEEFRDKHKVAVLYSLAFAAVFLMEPDEVPDMKNSDWETVMQQTREKALEKVKTNPMCKDRFLSIFDELMEIGLIS